MSSPASTPIRDVIERFAEAISRLTPEEHGFTHLDLTAARRRADELDVLPESSRGRLHGLIIPAKDLYDVAGQPTGFGSAYRRHMATSTEPFVQKLIDAGAIIPGKTATSELGAGAYCEPVAMPWPVNPRLPGRSPGGSSGGAAIAVALGLVSCAHGSDGGGSLRIPAASCNVVGYKPPHDVTGGSVSTQGFITRTVEENAYLHGLNLPTAPPKLRIGVLTEALYGHGDVDETWAQGALDCAENIRRAGHEVVTLAPFGQADEFFETFRRVFLGLAGAAPDPASPLVAWLRDQSDNLSPAEHQAAVARQAGIADELRALYDVDVLLTPTLASDPPPVGTFSAMTPQEDFDAQTRWTPWTSLANVTGLAAISVPFGETSVQFFALRVSPEVLLALAAANTSTIS